MPHATREPKSHPYRVLITGGAGFIGSHLVDLHLGLGDRVCVIDNLTTGRTCNLRGHDDCLQFIQGEVTAGIKELADSGDRFDAIYHLAAAVGVDLVLDDPVGSIRTNILQTDAILEFAMSCGSPPTFIASSSEVYGKPGVSVFSEDDDSIYGPTSITRWSYAHSKAIDEYLALGYWTQHRLPVVIGRFFNTVGPRQIGKYGMVLPRFVQAALTGNPLRVFGDGNQTRCFGDVRDVIRVLPKLLACTEAYGKVMNIGSDSSISIQELAQRVIDVLGSDSVIEWIDYSDAYVSGFEDLRHRKPDLTRLRSIVGYEPTHTIEQTIKDMAEYARTEPALNGGSA